jgi:hypothetical protein
MKDNPALNDACQIEILRKRYLFFMLLLLVLSTNRIEATEIRTIATAKTRGLPSQDPRRHLISRPLSEIAPYGTPQHKLLLIVCKAIKAHSNFELIDLPPEVARQILYKRSSMYEILKAWSESVRHNPEERFRIKERRALFHICVQDAFHEGHLSPRQVNELSAKIDRDPGPTDNSPLQKKFIRPMIDGVRLDWCKSFAEECGKPAADAFCMKMGYEEAKSYGGPDMAPNRTRCVGSREICNGSYCGGFHWIECEK